MIQNQIRPFVRCRAQADPRPEQGREPALEGDAEADGRRQEDQQARQHGGLQPRAAPRRRATANRDEGYLFWAAWLGHNSNSVFQVQDAHGVDRRIYLTIGCDEALSLLGASPLAPAVTGLKPLFAAGRTVRGGLQ